MHHDAGPIVVKLRFMAKFVRYFIGNFLFFTVRASWDFQCAEIIFSGGGAVFQAWNRQFTKK